MTTALLAWAVTAMALVAERDAGVPVAERHLAWTTNGARIVVDGQWLLDPERGSTTRITCRMSSTGAAQACPRGELVFAGGDGVALIFEDRILSGALPRPLGPPVIVPRWIRAEPADDPEVVNVAFWQAPGRLFVQQFSRNGSIPSVCRTLDVASGRWLRTAGGCLTADFSYLSQIDLV